MWWILVLYSSLLQGSVVQTFSNDIQLYKCSFIELTSAKIFPIHPKEIEPEEVRAGNQINGPRISDAGLNENIESKESAQRKAKPVIRTQNLLSQNSSSAQSSPHSPNNPTVNDIRARLEEASAVSQRMRRRLTMISFIAGLLPSCVCIVFNLLVMLFILSPYKYGYTGMWGAIMPWVICLMSLFVMPNDFYMIRLINGVAVMNGVFGSGRITKFIYLRISIYCNLHKILSFCFFIFSLFVSDVFGTGMYVAGAAYLYFGQPEVPKQNPNDPTINICSEEEPALGCALYVSRTLGIGILFLLTAWFMSRALITHKDVDLFIDVEFNDLQTKNVMFDIKQKFIGSRILNDEAFQIPARLALKQFWLAMRQLYYASGLLCTSIPIALHFSGEKALFYTDQYFIADFSCAVSFIICAACFTDRRRGAIMAFLNTINMEGNTSPI